MKEITLTFDNDDNVVIETVGFKGAACKAATKELEEALGGTEISVELKPEYKQTEVRSAARASAKR